MSDTKQVPVAPVEPVVPVEEGVEPTPVKSSGKKSSQAAEVEAKDPYSEGKHTGNPEPNNGNGAEES